MFARRTALVSYCLFKLRASASKLASRSPSCKTRGFEWREAIATAFYFPLSVGQGIIKQFGPRGARSARLTGNYSVSNLAIGPPLMSDLFDVSPALQSFHGWATRVVGCGSHQLTLGNDGQFGLVVCQLSGVQGHLFLTHIKPGRLNTTPRPESCMRFNLSQGPNGL